MTFGQMQGITEVFNHAKASSDEYKPEAFELLLRLINANYPKSDQHANMMCAAIYEEMELI